MEQIFEKAGRAKLRYESGKGLLSTEDLWDIPLTTLDKMAIAAQKQLKEDGETTSFLVNRTKANSELALRFEVLKHVITTRVAEADAAKARTASREQLAVLKELKAAKKLEGLKAMSEEELNKMIAEAEAATAE
jgi:hypothetical protein